MSTQHSELRARRVARRTARRTAVVTTVATSAQLKLERDDHAGILNIREEALTNTDYRRVIDTTQQMQQVLMYITPNDGGIDREVHLYSTQFINVISGRGEAVIDGEVVNLSDGLSITVPANTAHAIFNRVDEPLILHTIYAPPVHEPGLVQRTRYSEEE